LRIRDLRERMVLARDVLAGTDRHVVSFAVRGSRGGRLLFDVRFIRFPSSRRSSRTQQPGRADARLRARLPRRVFLGFAV
jgi:hypothetical protein